MITSDPYGISHAERPWDNLPPKHPVKRIAYVSDPPGVRAACLHCIRPRCVNCFAQGGARYQELRAACRERKAHR